MFGDRIARHDERSGPRPEPLEHEVHIHARLGGLLTIPDSAFATVVFAHGSGSNRHSPRNRFVASVLNDAGVATLLFDLITPDEAHDRAEVFDLDLLGQRLAAATRLVHDRAELQRLPAAYLGASTGAAVALRAAAAPDSAVCAVVSRGGRPDLAADDLDAVRAPTLLIVGGNDHAVLRLNENARSRLRCENQLVVVPGAGHLFEEPGALQVAAELARDWVVEHLGPPPTTVRAPAGTSR